MVWSSICWSHQPKALYHRMTDNVKDWCFTSILASGSVLGSEILSALEVRGRWFQHLPYDQPKVNGHGSRKFPSLWSTQEYSQWSQNLCHCATIPPVTSIPMLQDVLIPTPFALYCSELGIFHKFNFDNSSQAVLRFWFLWYQSS